MADLNALGNSGMPPPAPQNAITGLGASPNPMMPNAMSKSGTHRIQAHMIDGLPPEFVQALFEIAQLVDIDGDGTPDVAMVPLNAVGQNAMDQGGNALMRGGGQPRFASPAPGRDW